MLRIAFGRKNRTLSAEFNNKKVKEIIEKNYRTHCAINNLAVKMELNMSELIDAALAEVSMSDARARQMDIGCGLSLCSIRIRPLFHSSNWTLS